MQAHRSLKAVYIEQFFYPEGWSGAELARDIACQLKKNVSSLHVLCGSKPCILPLQEPKSNAPQDNHIDVCHLFISGKRTFFWRLLDQLVFCMQAFLRLLCMKNVSLLVVQTNPPPIVLVAAIVSAIKRWPLVILAMDIYPDALFAAMPFLRRTPLRFFLVWAYDISYLSASKVVSLGRVMTEKLLGKGVDHCNIVEIPNWATGDLSIINSSRSSIAKDWGIEDSFNLLYSGNLGIPHELDTVIYSLRQLGCDCPGLRLVAAASGSGVSKARSLADALGVAHRCMFKPLVPLEELPQLMGLARIAIVSIRRGYGGLVVPSKLSGIIARGVPVIYIGPSSEVKDIVDSSGSGVCFSNGDADGVSTFFRAVYENPGILNAYSAAASSFYRLHLAAPVGLAKYDSLFKSILAS